MTTSDDLFVLIKSLSKGEKIYFKKFAQLHVLGEENVYLRLFDAVDSQDRYDEKKLVQQFSSGKSASQFSVLKNYLYNLVLKSLRSYHAEHGLRAELRIQLQNIRLLFDKGLLEQCRKLYKRTLKQAEENELLRELSEVLIWEQQLLLYGKSYDRKTLEAVNANLEKRIGIYQRLQNLLEYDRLEYNMAACMHAGRAADAKKLLLHPLLKSEKLALSITALLKFHHIRATYFYHNGQKRECAAFIQRELKLFEAHPELLRQRVQDYILLTNNLLLILLEDGALQKFDARLKTFRTEMASVELNSLLFSLAMAHNYILEMQRHYHSANLKAFEQAAAQLNALLTGFKASLNQSDLFALLDLSSRMYLLAGKADRALDYSVRLLNEAEVESKFARYADARLLNLVLHFEMKNFDSLPYLIQSFERQVLKKHSKQPLFTALIRFLKKFPSAVQRHQREQQLSELSSTLESSESNSSYFNYRQLLPRWNGRM